MITTTAAVLRAPDAAFERETVTLGDLGPHDVLVRIVGTGFCHTDLMPRGIAAGVLPAILGHEGSGVVVDVGTEVSTVKPGDSVVLSFASCGECKHCRSGVPAYCVNFLGLNMSGRALDGAVSATDSNGAPIANRWFGQSSFAHHCIVSERSAVVVDGTLPLALLGPLGCGIQTGAGAVFNEMGMEPGQSIAVFGAGAVGLAAVMAAKVAGAADIVAVDRVPARLELALELGATRVVLADDPNLVEVVRGSSGGLDFALDTTAVAGVISAAIAAVSTGGGEVVLVGAGADSITVHPSMLTGKRISYSLEGGSDPQQLIPVLIQHWQEGDFPFDRLIATYGFEDIADAEADSRSGRAVKPVLLIDAD